MSASSSVSRRLEGKVALITGGASGIGACTAKVYVRHGAKVIIADIQDDLCHSLCQELGEEDAICYIHCDVTSDSDVRNAVDLAVAKYGKLDIMFNNAGISGSPTGILGTNNEDFKRVLEVNLFGAFLGAKHASRVMIPAKKGCILFTSSVASVISMGPIFHPYAASKHAVVGLAKNLCIELGQYGIRVNCISPYVVATPLAKPLGIIEKKKVEEIGCQAANLKGVVLEAEDIAEAAMYLGSDESKYVSGINLVVDGGYGLTNPSFSMAAKSFVS